MASFVVPTAPQTRTVHAERPPGPRVTVPALAGSATPPVDAAVRGLQALCEQLNRSGWPARLVRSSLCGESDVRLQVGRLGTALVVEVLGPFADRLPGGAWQAVRITPRSRVVWCGPEHDCPPSELLVFVEDLLCRDLGDLLGRWLCVD